MEVIPVTRYDSTSQENEHDYYSEDSEEVALTEALAKRLEAELRTAKRTHLSVGEVLLPHGLTRRIAEDMFMEADVEPCGLRGCTLYINFEGEGVKRTLSTIKCDPTTPSTFELYLTLRQSSSGWNTFLPQFLKKITRSGLMISPEYHLQKKKLYRSFSDY